MELIPRADAAAADAVFLPDAVTINGICGGFADGRQPSRACVRLWDQLHGQLDGPIVLLFQDLDLLLNVRLDLGREFVNQTSPPLS